MRKAVLTAITLAGLTAWQAFADDLPTLPAVDSVVKPYLGQDAPGIAVLVMRHGQVLHMRGYGFADIVAKVPVDEHTVFDLASVSKQMTAQAAALEMQDGLLRRDTLIGDVLPAFAADTSSKRPLKVDDLLHHIGGVADYLDGSLDYDGTTTNAEVVDWLAQQPRERQPGIAFSYSNSGYVVLANVVATVDDADTLRDVLQNRIWTPLGMTETGLVTPASGMTMAKGYLGTESSFQPSSYPNITEGDGNVMTNLTDLAKYEHALATNQLLSAKATTALFVDGKFDSGKPIADPEDGTGYGFGWELEHAAGSDYAQHTGSWMGTSTAYQRNLDSGLTVIVLSNGEDLSAGQLAAEIEAKIDP